MNDRETADAQCALEMVFKTQGIGEETSGQACDSKIASKHARLSVTNRFSLTCGLFGINLGRSTSLISLLTLLISGGPSVFFYSFPENQFYIPQFITDLDGEVEPKKKK